MTVAMWKQVPEWIENPVAVFKTQDEKHPGRLVLFAPEVINGRPVRVILDPKNGMAGMDVHVALNAYEEGGTHTTPVDKWAKKGDLLYLNQQLSPALNERSGLRLPRDVRQLRGCKHRVLTEADRGKDRAKHDSGVRYSREAATAGADAEHLVDARRQWLEKGTNLPCFHKWLGDSKAVDARGKPGWFNAFTDEMVQMIEDEFNDRPRKLSGFKTPRTVLLASRKRRVL